MKKKRIHSKCSRYIDGRCLKKYYCIDCKAKLQGTSAYKHKRCNSCASKNRWKSVEYKQKMLKILNNKTRKRLKRKDNNLYIDGRTSKKYHCIEPNCNDEISYSCWQKGQGRCNKHASEKKWRNKEYREKITRLSAKALNLSPNKPERLLNTLLNKILPKEYKFVGNGKIILGGFCPDFINMNGQKKIIELYGDYWHNLPDYKERDKRRIKIYKNFGYKTLIIWEHELKDRNILEIKLETFSKK